MIKAKVIFNPLSTNPAKWSNTLKIIRRLLPTNCLMVFDHFVGLALKGLRSDLIIRTSKRVARDQNISENISEIFENCKE